MKTFLWIMSLSQRNLRGGGGVSIELKLNKLDLSGNTTEFKTLPDAPTLTSLYNVLYIRDGI